MRLMIPRVGVVATVVVGAAIIFSTATTGAVARSRPSAVRVLPPALQRAAILEGGERHGRIAGARIGGTEMWVVYLQTVGRCGSGGCVPQLWRREGGRFVRVGSVTVAKLPINTLPGTAGGMPVLGISVYDKENNRIAVQPLTFDGQNYRSRPSEPLLPESAGAPLVTSFMLRGF